MKAKKTSKKKWTKPVVQTLSVRRDTASGISTGPEGAGYFGAPGPPGRS